MCVWKEGGVSRPDSTRVLRVMAGGGRRVGHRQHSGGGGGGRGGGLGPLLICLIGAPCPSLALPMPCPYP